MGRREKKRSETSGEREGRKRWKMGRKERRLENIGEEEEKRKETGEYCRGEKRKKERREKSVTGRFSRRGRTVLRVKKKREVVKKKREVVERKKLEGLMNTRVQEEKGQEGREGR